MKPPRWQIVLAALLVALAVGLHGLHYWIFQDYHHIWIYLLGDIAFVPLDVLLVTLVLHELLGRREKRALMRKLNMVIGAFFSEVGLKLLKQLTTFDSGELGEMHVTPDWGGRDFDRARRAAADRQVQAETFRPDLEKLRDFLKSRRGFLLGLLEKEIGSRPILFFGGILGLGTVLLLARLPEPPARVGQGQGR